MRKIFTLTVAVYKGHTKSLAADFDIVTLKVEAKCEEHARRRIINELHTRKVRVSKITCDAVEVRT